MKVKDGKLEVHYRVSGERTVYDVEDPLLYLRRFVGRSNSLPQRFRLIGGSVGYISYDAVRYWEPIPSMTVDCYKFSDFEMGIFRDGIVLDHKTREAFYYHMDKSRLSELLSLTNEGYGDGTFVCSEPKANVAKEEFERNVAKAKEYICAGDIFQVVLSKRHEFRFKGSLILFYRELREINPSPYMYFLKMGERQIVGSSPEMLVRVENDRIETFPIAGTRPRVGVAPKDRALRKELLDDQKERAEHVMLVDLARNDIGKVSEFGSVTVPEFMRVYQYSHVQHMVSKVSGRLHKGCDCFDALRAVFPAGTVSGAPKVRAMEIIEECEHARRGLYAGAVGYFSYNGNADFAITIRTLIACRGSAYIQTGAGIVADSDPEREWLETEHKATALLNALQLSREGEAHESSGHRQL